MFVLRLHLDRLVAVAANLIVAEREREEIASHVVIAANQLEKLRISFDEMENHRCSLSDFA